MTDAPDRRSTTDDVFVRLRQQILAGELGPGSRHSVYRLSDELGVSRTPVREAVLRLADLGLVTIERNRGITIRGVRAEDVRDVFELRLMLEVPGRRRGRRRTPTTSWSIGSGRRWRPCGRPRAPVTRWPSPATIVPCTPRWGRRSATCSCPARSIGCATPSRCGACPRWGSTRTMADVAEEHAPIVEAVAAGDAAAAATAMREHLEHTAALLLGEVGAPLALRTWASRP